MVTPEDVAMHIQPNEAAVDDTDTARRTWQSCCFACDREVVLYVTKTAVTVSVLVFAMYRIVSNTDPCKDLSFPTGLICTILGSFIEQGHQRMMKK